MDILKQLNLKQANVLKMVGMGLVAIIVIAFTVRLVGSSFGSVTSALQRGRSEGGVAMAPSAAYGGGYGYNADVYMEDAKMGGVPTLSQRNIMPPDSQPVPGRDAENFEVTSYSATIETRELDKTCQEIADLKGLSYVIFEQANKYDRGCSYTFKVEKKSAEEILNKLQALNPKYLSQNTHTIKRVLDDFTSEEDILKKKKASIEQTLEDALKAYTDITNLATRTQDAETLARVIESKLQAIERLTQERINVNEQLDRLSRAKGEQLDRLEYTYFSVNVVENKYLDGKELKDSWKEAVRAFVRDLNQVAQDITINLIALVMLGLQYFIYFFIVLIFIKLGWKVAKSVWNK